MNRAYIIDAISAILEDIYGHPMKVPMREELEAFFEPEELDEFRRLVSQEFDLADDTIVDTAESFLELVALLEDDLFS